MRESEGERQRIWKCGWGLCQYTQTEDHTYRACLRGTHTHTQGLGQGKHYDISNACPTDKNQIMTVNSKLRIYRSWEDIQMTLLMKILTILISSCTTRYLIDKYNEEKIPLILKNGNSKH